MPASQEHFFCLAREGRVSAQVGPNVLAQEEDTMTRASSNQSRQVVYWTPSFSTKPRYVSAEVPMVRKRCPHCRVCPVLTRPGALEVVSKPIIMSVRNLAKFGIKAAGRSGSNCTTSRSSSGHVAMWSRQAVAMRLYCLIPGYLGTW